MGFMLDYITGRQPCKTLISYEGYISEPTIEYPCPHNCGGTVTFCEACRKDHHSGGWETCVNGDDTNDCSDKLRHKQATAKMT